MSPQASGIGTDWIVDLPEGWDVVKLKHIASVQNSNVDKKSEEGELPVRLCNYVDVYYNDRITPDLDFMQATATRAEIDKFRLREGDVIVTKDSESRDDIAIPAYVTRDFEDVLCGYHLALLRPQPATVDGRFLRYCFSAEKINLQFQVGANGITRYGLSLDALGGALFPVPSLEEQIEIADFLDRKTAAIDGIIQKKERLITLLQEKRQAVISRAVTRGLDPGVPMKHSGVEWLWDVPAHWEVKRMWAVSTAQSGGTPTKAEPDYWNGHIPWVSPKDMKRRLIDSSEDTVTERAIAETGIKLLAPPVVLIVVRGMILAHTFPVAVTTVPVTINQDMKALRFRDGLDPLFMAWVLQGLSRGILSTMVEEAAHGTRAIRMDQWRSLTVPVPPAAEQRDITALLERQTGRIDTLLKRVQQQIARLNEYRQTLISGAVTGKIDVREAVAA